MPARAMPNRWLSDIVAVCHRLYARGLVTASDGNVSIRLGNGNILTNRSGINKGDVTPRDLIEVDLNGNIIRNRQSAIRNLKPSTELGMHLFIYRQRPDVHAVVHAHPVYATGFAAARQPLTKCVLPEVVVGLGAIPLAEYATPSTDEVARSLEPFVKNADAILLANHGVVTCGKDVWEAYYKMEKVEHAAHITFVARMLGGEQALTAAQVKKLRAISLESYGIDFSEKIPCKPCAEGENSVPSSSKMDAETVADVLKKHRALSKER